MDQRTARSRTRSARTHDGFLLPLDASIGSKQVSSADKGETPGREGRIIGRVRQGALSCAYYLAMKELPGERFFDKALPVPGEAMPEPLAIPSYRLPKT